MLNKEFQQNTSKIKRNARQIGCSQTYLSKKKVEGQIWIKKKPWGWIWVRINIED